MGSALSTFVGAIGSVKELIQVMVKVCNVFNKPPDHDGMGNAPKVGQNRDRLIKEAQQQMGMDARSPRLQFHFLRSHKSRQVHTDQCNPWREAQRQRCRASGDQ